jgi:hypothetical protein
MSWFRRTVAVAVLLVACRPGGDRAAPPASALGDGKEAAMAIELETFISAAGASRMYVNSTSQRVVSEHRRWTAAAYAERAEEAPGLVKLLAADGSMLQAASGWALGGALADDSAAWVAEASEEYRYQVVRSDGAAVALQPPDDFWVMAGAVGHPTSPLAAVVLWRPAGGSPSNDPARRRDELWIAAIDRRGPTVVATRQLALNLPTPRVEGVMIGGSPSAPVLALIGVPDPGQPGVYRAVGWKLPSLQDAWETRLDIAAVEKTRPPVARADAAAASVLPPPPQVDAASALGDDSGWLVGHGTRIRDIHTTTLSFVIDVDGAVHALPGLRVRAGSHFGPMHGSPAVWVLAMAGERNHQEFIGVDLVWPRQARIDTVVDRRSRMGAKTLEQDPHLQPETVAIRGSTILLAPPALGDRFGVDAPDVAGLLTTPGAWHQSKRPRVIARTAWLRTRQ